MEPKLRQYIENLFVNAPNTKQAYELREEIISNTIERYHDLLAEGRTQGDAYNLAISGIGNINELLQELGAQPVAQKKYTDEQLGVIKGRHSIFLCIAIVMYILCTTPCIILGTTSLASISPAIMFVMISVATGLIIYANMTKYVVVMDNEDQKRKLKNRSLLRAIGVGCYISCVIPCILLASTPMENISPVFMFIMIAVATVLVILSKNRNEYQKTDETLVENFKEFNSRKKTSSALYRTLVAILWVVTAFLYVYLTYITCFSATMVTWIIFIIAIAVQNIMRAIFDYVEASK